MKLKIIFAAAIAALIFASCSKDSGETALTENIETTNVYLKLTKGGISRAMTDSVVHDGDAISINTGYLYFTTSAGQITNVFTINIGSDANTLSSSELEAGKTLTNIKSNATTIYFLGNVPSELSLSTTGSIDAVIKTLTDMSTQIDSDGGVSNVLLYGLGDIVISSGDSSRSASITAQAQVARIEIEYLTMEGNVTYFQLDGIFINNFYFSATLDGTVDGGLTYYGSDANFTQDDASVPMYSSNYSGITHDFDATSGIEQNAGADFAVWAYNIFTADGNVPHIILKFSDIETSNGTTFNSPQFITVKGFNDASTGTSLSKLEKGKVYKFASGIPVDDSNFTSEPELESVDVDVAVQVMAWEEHNITPEI